MNGKKGMRTGFYDVNAPRFHVWTDGGNMCDPQGGIVESDEFKNVAGYYDERLVELIREKPNRNKSYLRGFREGVPLSFPMRTPVAPWKIPLIFTTRIPSLRKVSSVEFPWFISFFAENEIKEINETGRDALKKDWIMGL